MTFTPELIAKMQTRALKRGHTEISFPIALQQIIDSARWDGDIKADLVWFGFATEKMLAA